MMHWKVEVEEIDDAVLERIKRPRTLSPIKRDQQWAKELDKGCLKVER